MEDKNYEISQSDFELVNLDSKIHDKAFETKPTTFFKDAIRRFCKNKSSLVAFCIIGLIVVLAIFLPIFSNKNIDFVSKDEAFLAPKLFKAGTGFWDGTRKYENMVLNTSTNKPADYYEPGVFNLEITGPGYINTTSKYGKGGYVVLVNETKNTLYSYSYPTKMTPDGNYNVSIKFHELEDYNEGEIGEFAIYLLTDIVEREEEDETGTKVKIYKKILLQDFSKNFSEVSFNLSDALRDANITETEASIYFEIKPAVEKAKSYIMIESVKFNANSDVENYADLVNTISMNDANESLQLFVKDNVKPLGYWTATATQNIYHVEVIFCNFTYDTYAKPYGDKIVTYAYSNFKELKDKGIIDYDESDIKGTFKVLNTKKCPIYSEEEMEGGGIIDVKYKSSGPRKPLEIKCIAKGYMTYNHGKSEPTYRNEPKFLFGTDDCGFDILKRSFISLRTSLLLGVAIAALCFAFGLVWGSISGYFGGTVDLLMERFCDILGGVPSTIVLTIAILKFGNNFFTFMMALCLTGWMGVAARTRTQFYRYKGREYILASRTLGSSDFRLIFKHILPNSMGTIITGSVFLITSVISSEATLAYLKLGLQGTRSFGVMMSDNQNFLKSYPYMVLEPAIIFSLLMISFNLFGNGLRDAFNPSLKGSE